MHGAWARRKRAVLQILELAFIHCGPRGIHRARLAIGDLLAGWPDTDDDMTASFPAGWSADPQFFPVSLDLTSAQLTPHEDASIRDWYTGLDRRGAQARRFPRGWAAGPAEGVPGPARPGNARPRCPVRSCRSSSCR